MVLLARINRAEFFGLKETLSIGFSRRIPFWVVFTLLVSCTGLSLLSFLYFVPDPFFSPDSIGYSQGPLAVLTGQTFTLPDLRAIGYPLFLLVVLKVFSSFKAVLFFQHAMQIIIGASMAILFFRANACYGIAGLLLCFFVTMEPRLTYHAHSILTDEPYTCLQGIVMVLFFSAIRKPTIGRGIATGLAAALAFNVRDVGLTLVAAILLTGVVFYKSRRVRMASLWALAAFMVGCLPFVAYNLQVRHIAGTERRSADWVFRNLSQYLDLNRVDDPSVRAALAPLYQTPVEIRRSRKDPEWPSGLEPSSLIEDDPVLRDRAQRIYLSLTWDVICQAPFVLIRDAWESTSEFLSVSTTVPRLLVPAASVLVQGFDRFEKMTIGMPAARRFLTPDAAKALNDHDTAALKKYIERISTGHFFPFDQRFWLWRPVFWVAPLMGWAGWGGLLSGTLLLFSARSRLLAFFCLSLIGAHLLPVATGGGYAIRYAIPIMPIYLLLIWLAGAWFWKRTTIWVGSCLSLTKQVQ
jgi:hypothetical protein